MRREMVALALLTAVAAVPLRFGPSVAAAPRATAPAVAAVDVAADSLAHGHDVADATTLYNAGTVALERSAYGPSITFFLAAARLEPRAPDVRANLEGALAAAAHAAGDDEHPDDAADRPFPIAPDEGWRTAAGLLAVGACFGIARAVRVLSRSARRIGDGAMIAGIVLSTWLQYAAWEERAHPVAVVIAPTLSVERGPDEPSRPAVLLAAGERVRLGEVRGGQVEVRLGANRIGWAAREGLWRVADATRYTPKFQPR